MKIIVCIKQVPETSNVKMDRITGTMIRDGVETIINPLDLYAIETALRLKEKHGGVVKVITMGPKNANKALKEAVAMGCDEPILISDAKFAGADTYATSYVLSEVIKRIEDFDLILTGERATDGDTGQVGPGIAAFLDISLGTYISSIEKINSEHIITERLLEDSYEKISIKLPALLSIVKEISSPRLPTLGGKKRAKRINIPKYSRENLELKLENLGLKGSPTRVVKIETPKVLRKGKIFHIKNPEQIEPAVDSLINFLKKKEIL